MKLKLCEVCCDEDKLSEDLIKEVLLRSCIRDYAYILHDSDATRPHWHIAIRFNDSQDTRYISSWFGVADNFVSKVKGRWSDMMKYLTHKNRPEKFQYSDDLVKSNYDWLSVRDEKSDKEKVAEILKLIDSETLREYNIGKYLSIEEFDKYKKHIENGFKYVQNRLAERVDRKMEVVFIAGRSGCGKTSYAKKLCEEKGYSFYVSDGGKNPLDGYKGQDAIILDDLRASDYKYSELLKLLDNNTSSSAACRYYNKSMVWCKLIIITSCLDMELWYKSLQEYESEPLVQLKRRCRTYIYMGLNTMEVKLYSKRLNDYPDAGYICENPVKQLFEDDEEEDVDFLNKMFGSLEFHRAVDDFEPVNEQLEFEFLP